MTGEGPVTENATATQPANSRYGMCLVRAQINDADRITNGDVITAAEAYVDLPPWHPNAVAIPLAAEDGNFNSTSEFVIGNIRSGPGQHMIFLRGRDAAGNWGPVTAVFSPHANS